MRKYLFVFALFLTLILTGCTQKDIPPDREKTPSKVQVVELPENLSLDDTEKDTETKREDVTPTLTPNSEPQPMLSESPKQNESKQPQTSTTTKPSDTITETKDEPPKETASEIPDAPEVPTRPNATAVDADEIANLVVKYINDYRIAEGTSAAVHLPGLTEYAKYRSRQIIADFSHNTYDERAAATALSYGMYVEPSLYGMNGEPYYTACAGEAIAKGGYAGTVDYIAKSLANLIRNSSKHWVYVGASDYKYIGVGITYESGMWYCDVALTRDNYG